MRAAWKGHVEAVRLIIDREKACVLEVDSDGATALHYAALGGDPEASNDRWLSRSSVIYQIARAPLFINPDDIEVEPVDSAGWTPLMIAAAAGHANAVRALIRLGARPNFSAAYGKSPLSLAIEGGHEEVVRVFQEEATLHGYEL